MNLTVLLFFLFFFGCKTAEEIQREQLVDSLAVQMVESQKINADSSVKLQSIEELITQLRGSLEQSSYAQRTAMQTEIQNINEDIVLLKEENKTLQDALEDLKKDLVEQKKYITQVLNSLNKISAPRTSSYDQAIANYKSGKYKTAKGEILALLEDKSITGDRLARLYHNLGMIEYFQKNYQNALVYFSKLFTDFPNASYNSNGLLYLGKSFLELNKKEEAAQTFNELMSKYPKSESARKAKALLAQHNTQ
ncbi:MAG: hypothetical protein A2504_07275 [Bdellovibrionales bacterium RIFOXYD12_FULL_39_22]|nr:MAG: hypothetical protein A2385_16645 [Bdellovibrionales bacterium RIFOXYB1_FULL_39_21]OFZ44679.1 MAG: hypothetical protein A2485_14505 [Bdellovibrionales bacterium RIFOXYC12_FULL_39_17]OFZ49309.1 MAG: hypothetical protein A2404_08800 [Bdellovibrionales bacterium RIFOXYC1_FULL_39_130]OFZ77045.1 MAG: hypothetical protein A2560_09765 [Bdellovibrionales bacterium RIFOXYD1_FULL_39_84]OFZ95305.1 MAG: hypothetical protein A2504_07275 [Bdellovibrionales bacterium RIFOXYD12_FULL_39_22]HLE13079.1 te